MKRLLGIPTAMLLLIFGLGFRHIAEWSSPVTALPYDYANSIVFTTGDYNSSWTPPTITAPSLTAANVVWHRLSDGATTATDA